MEINATQGLNLKESRRELELEAKSTEKTETLSLEEAPTVSQQGGRELNPGTAIEKKKKKKKKRIPRRKPSRIWGKVLGSRKKKKKKKKKETGAKRAQGRNRETTLTG